MKIVRIALALTALMLLAGAAPMVPFSDTGVPGAALVPGNGDAMVPNALGGTPPPPPPTCPNTLDFSQACNSQYVGIL